MKKDPLRDDPQLFKKFRDLSAQVGVTTRYAGDFGKEQTWEDEFNQNWRLVETMGKNSFFKIIPQHNDSIIIEPRDRYLKCDALIWRDRRNGVDPILICPTGDCPILAISEKDSLSVLALVHSGRKGTVQGIVPQVIETLERSYSLFPNEFEFALWPGICQDCYEVEKELVDMFPPELVKKGTRDKAYPDLKGVILSQLALQGVSEENISVLNYCSYHSLGDEEYLFHSLRRENASARNAVFIFR